MALINATWRVTHAGSVVLLDWDDLMEGEPAMDQTSTTDRFPALLSRGMVNRTRFNVANVASFSRRRIFESDFDAREFMRQHNEDLQAVAVPEHLEIEWANQFTGTTLTSAVLSGYKSRVENNHFFADYTLSGGVIIPNTTIMVAAAGNDNFTVTTPFLGMYVIGPFNGGVFTRTISLLGGTNSGDTCDIYISLAAQTGPTVEIHDLTSGGTLLYTVTATTAAATHGVFRAVWDGSHWVAGTFAVAGGVFFF